MHTTEDQIDDLYKKLGGSPVLIPCPKGSKEPFGDDWDSVTFADTQAADYQEELRGDLNVGVLTGYPSANRSLGEKLELVAINVQDDAAAAEFATLNADTIQETFATSAANGCVFWLWLKGRYPESGDIFEFKEDGTPDREKLWGSWLAFGSQAIVHGTHPDGFEYGQSSASSKTIKTKFDALKWPETLALPWVKIETIDDRVRSKYGEPFYASKSGSKSVNQPYYVGRYAEENKVLFEIDEEEFYEYEEETGLWRRVDSTALRWSFSNQLLEIAEELNYIGLITKRTSGWLQSLVELLKGCVGKRDVFNPKPGIIHLRNGLLNILTEPISFTEFTALHYSRNQIPFALDEGADCPRFKEELLGKALEDPDVDAMQRWAGMCLLGHNFGQKILVLTGTAGGGKSTFMNIIQEVIGIANIAALRTDQLVNRFELWNYVGKTLLIGSDVPGNFLNNEGAYVLKSLVGGDPLTAEKKNGDAITIFGHFNVGITSNSRLTVKLDGDVGAWERRLILIPYELPRPEKPDPLFKEKLIEEEGAGILNWMIEGALAVMEDFKSEGKFHLGKLQKDRIDDLLAESDSIRNFIKTCVFAAADSDITKEELHTAYVAYCDRRGWKSVAGQTARSRLNDTMLEVHRASERKDISRPKPDGGTGTHRGYGSFAILAEGDPED
jgi:P4 family phage/plasmid primase-like protien